ncbi:hypothetical protein HIM_08277 [Hirsutella minnesotensis 3608]|uniref:Uncharacterized protein n=1 Tax=Hirsutella minnesotensis 3608 TaxID=1043627 RepID=A0A0F7ZHB5_9HYPO|nr:hypothetical protein HIM_08277 [Hirsutella minnesotensis 3608]
MSPLEKSGQPAVEMQPPERDNAGLDPQSESKAGSAMSGSEDTPVRQLKPVS